MEKSTSNLALLDTMINKTGTKTWVDIYNKPTDSKRYLSSISNHILEIFHSVWLDDTIDEEENTKLKWLSDIKLLD